MLVYIAWDGDHIGRQVGRAAQADDADALRQISQRIDLGNQIWRSWVESLGGNLVSMGGDEGRAQIPADHLDELPGIREQYAGKVGSAVSVGVGVKLSEADKALLAAKLQGGDRILFYSEEVDQQLEEARQKGERTEEQKIADEYLNKTVPGGDQRMDHHAAHHEAVDPSIKREHLGEDRGYQVYLVDGDKIRHTIDADFTMGGNPGRYKYVPEGEIWVDSNTNTDEIPEVVDHELTECKSMEEKGASYGAAHDAANRKEFKKAAPAMNSGAFAGAARPSGPTVNKPVATQGDHEQGQVLNEMLESSAAPAPAEQTHAAKDFERQLHEEAWKGEEEDMGQQAQKSANLEQIKAQLVQALQVLKAQAPVLEQMKQAAPQAYQAVSGLAQATIALARELAPAQPMQKAEDLVKGLPRVTASKHPARANDQEIYRYVQGMHTGAASDLNKIPMDANFHLVDVPLAKLPALRPPTDTNAQRYAQLKTPFPPIVIAANGSIPDGHTRIAAARLRGDKSIRAYVQKAELKTEEEPHDAPKAGAELEKAKLPMPGANAHHHVVLPSGSTVGDKVKVTHQDGSVGWKQVGAGMILGQDPAHHPVSSREPDSR